MAGALANDAAAAAPVNQRAQVLIVVVLPVVLMWVLDERARIRFIPMKVEVTL
jgi:hypothetical protein